MRLGLGIAAILIALAPARGEAHGGYTLENDPCVARTQGRFVHFAAYQPDHNPTEEYCDELPEVGRAILVLDLVDRELRTLAIGLRVRRPDGSVLVELPERAYPAGVINTETRFEVPGRYTAELSSSGSPSVEFPLDVATGFSPLLLAVPLVLAAAPALYWAARRGAPRRPPPVLTAAD